MESIQSVDEYNIECWITKNGVYHREDGPATTHPDGSKFWHRYGKLHRTDGPACEYANGAKEWYQDGKLHRLDGPAIIFPSGHYQWYINGRFYPENSTLVKLLKAKAQRRKNGNV